MSYLEHEDEIVWEEDPEYLPYVREMFAFAGTRRRPVPFPYKGLGRRVGYAVLRHDAPHEDGAPGVFSRRFFWVKDYDRSESPDGTFYRTGCPAEGVDPLTVRVGARGRVTERAWGAPLPR
jgi:Family of unknown function (DUF6009)